MTYAPQLRHICAIKTQTYWGSLDVPSEVTNALITVSTTAEELVGLSCLRAPLSVKGEAGRFHWEHSGRVGLLCYRIAKTMLLDSKALLFAGLLHDIGKALVPPEVLGRTDKWTAKDQDAIEPHVMDGFRLLRGKFDFSAQIIAEHHRFQPCCYPLRPAPKLHPYSNSSKAIIGFYGRLLSLADSFDAMHRVNSKGKLTGKQIRERMEKQNRDMLPTIRGLYTFGVFPVMR